MRVRFLQTLLLASIALTSRATFAQDAGGAPAGAAPDERTRRQAREAFATGEKAFQKNDYVGALAAFERAFALASHDAVRFNLAVCLERLGRPSEALLQYEAAAKSETLTAAERQRAARAAAELRSKVGTLVVQDHDGAAVSVDARGRCTAPCRVDLDPGVHQVVVGEGPRERRERVEIQAGKELVLPPAASTPPPPPLAPTRDTARQTDPPSDVPPVPPSRGPGWLTWTGAAVATVGVAGVVGFGLSAQSLHDDYTASPTEDERDSGLLMRNFANVSIGVAALGAAVVAFDLLFLAPRPRAEQPTRTGALPRGTR